MNSDAVVNKLSQYVMDAEDRRPDDVHNRCPPITEEAIRRNPELHVLKGVVFDMDGTLTLASNLDFRPVYAKYGVPPNTDLLTGLKKHPEHVYAEALEMIREIEAVGVATLINQPGVEDMLRKAQSMGLKLAILTRNELLGVKAFLSKFSRPEFRFDAVLTRNDVPHLPPKPSPACVKALCQLWGIPPQSVAMVGDFITDLQCGNRAGARSVLVRNENNAQHEPFAFASVWQLSELIPLFEEWSHPV